MSLSAETAFQAQTARIEAYRRTQAEGQERFLKEVGGLVEEIQGLRKAAEETAAKLNAKATTLREVVRRSPDEGTSNLLVFATAHLRLAGALQQGAKRTASVDRCLRKADEERKEAKQREEQETLWVAARRQAKALEQAVSVSKEDAFDDLYGDIIDEKGLTHGQ